MRRPSREFELQLAILDIQLTHPLLLPLQTLKELARAVLGGDHTQRANNHNQKKKHIYANHYSFSATRITALRARGLARISATEGLICLPTKRSFGFGN